MRHSPVLSRTSLLETKPGGRGTTQPLIIEQGCEQAVAWLVRKLSAAGLRVASSDFLCSRRCPTRGELGGLRAVPSFDLHAVLSLPCPRHRNGACTCQMAVVSVQDRCGAWGALIARGQGGRTWVTLVDTAARPLPGGLANTVRRAIANLST